MRGETSKFTQKLIYISKSKQVLRKYFYFLCEISDFRREVDKNRV